MTARHSKANAMGDRISKWALKVGLIKAYLIGRQFPKGVIKNQRDSVRKSSKLYTYNSECK